MKNREKKYKIQQQYYSYTTIIKRHERSQDFLSLFEKIAFTM